MLSYRQAPRTMPHCPVRAPGSGSCRVSQVRLSSNFGNRALRASCAIRPFRDIQSAVLFGEVDDPPRIYQDVFHLDYQSRRKRPQSPERVFRDQIRNLFNTVGITDVEHPQACVEVSQEAEFVGPKEIRVVHGNVLVVGSKTTSPLAKGAKG